MPASSVKIAENFRISLWLCDFVSSMRTSDLEVDASLRAITGRYKMWVCLNEFLHYHNAYVFVSYRIRLVHDNDTYAAYVIRVIYVPFVYNVMLVIQCEAE